jgi:FkbM family methyltransferase
MNWRSFLYRRLGRIATCELALPTGGTLALASKYEVASAADVIVHPFYWQLFHLLDSHPASIVDCGGHCGHFTVIADICIRLRFDRPAENYTVIEANPLLLQTLKRTIERVGLTKRTKIVQAAAGCDGEFTDLWVQNKNFLISGVTAVNGSQRYRVPCVSVGNVVPPGPIDVLKIDIEGSEFGLLRNEPDLFRRTRLLFVETHADSEDQRRSFESTLEQIGFRSVGPQVAHCGMRLAVLRRD